MGDIPPVARLDQFGVWDQALINDQVCVWGLGLIGYTLAGELAKAGVRPLLVDIDNVRVDALNEGKLPFAHLPSVGERYLAQARSGAMRATTDVSRAADYQMHVLCVQTERAGQIDSGPLRAVVRSIISARRTSAGPTWLIVESTIAPSWTDLMHDMLTEAGWRNGREYHLGVSPRRDWLIDEGRTLADLPKIIGGDSAEAVELMRRLYGLVCRTVLTARDAKHAAMTKVVENYLRYRDIVVANELAAAFPGLDIAGTLRLAATKWNIGLYRPSLGIGGYCVPLAKDYLAEESDARAWLVDTVQETASRVFASARAQVVAALRGSDVAVLGVAYAANMKICTLSPSLDLVRDLVAAGIETYVADPLYTAEDLASLVDAKVATFPEVLVQVRAVVLMTAHDQFMTISDAELGVLLERCTMIIDNTGSWRQRQLPPHVRYLEVGAGQIASTALQPVSGP